MSEIGKRTVARICNFLRGSHAAERLFLRGAFAALGMFFAYVFVAGHWSVLFVIGLCALGYKANVEARVADGSTRYVAATPVYAGQMVGVVVGDEARIHRIIRDASGTPISATPIALGDSRSNVLVPTLDGIDRAVNRMGGDCRKVEQVAREMRAELSEREAQRRSFAYGNVSISNPSITRADIDRAADAMAWDDETADTAVRP
jgi:hypothetical protein